jgi:hypothetical protein
MSDRRAPTTKLRWFDSGLCCPDLRCELIWTGKSHPGQRTPRGDKSSSSADSNRYPYRPIWESCFRLQRGGGPGCINCGRQVEEHIRDKDLGDQIVETASRGQSVNPGHIRNVQEDVKDRVEFFKVGEVE